MKLFKLIKKYRLVYRLKERRSEAFLLWLKYYVHNTRSMFCEGVVDATSKDMHAIDRALIRIKRL